jgi:hypothetical protein
MAKRRDVAKPNSAKQLLKTLTDSPALPAFIQRLQPPVLKRLIEHVGLRDAGELIALTTTAQLREVFEESLWENLIPGKVENLQPGKFLEWLDVMLDVSPAFAAERLVELGDAFVVLNFGPLIRIVDRSAAALLSFDDAAESFDVLKDESLTDDLCDEFCGHLVRAVHEDEWDAVRTILTQLQSDYPDFLDHVLARCFHQPSALGFNDDGQAFHEDETFAREQRREQKGFVTPHIAALFLRAARAGSLAQLCDQRDYDAVSHKHFEQLANAAQQPVVEPEPDEVIEPQEPPLRSELRSLEAALVQAEIVSDVQPKLLAGPTGTREPMLELQTHLDRLQLTAPQVFSARLGELIFLANVLMAGSWYQGARFTETQAAQAALACANLGVDYLAAEASSERSEFIATVLEDRPGIVRLFQVGWHLLQQVPLRAAHALLDALRADHVRKQLAHKRWMLDEIETAVSNPDLLALVQDGEFADVSDNLVLLALVLDARACHCLRTLISDFPRYPTQLRVGFRPGQSAVNGTQYIKTRAELDKVEEFLGELDRLIKI